MFQRDIKKASLCIDDFFDSNKYDVYAWEYDDEYKEIYIHAFVKQKNIGIFKSSYACRSTGWIQRICLNQHTVANFNYNKLFALFRILFGKGEPFNKFTIANKGK